MGKGLGAIVLVFLGGALAFALYAHGPIPQPASYHAFADTRTLHRIPNALNVLSNVVFLVVAYGPTLARLVSTSRLNAPCFRVW